MEFNAFKMDGLGNDFVIIDQRKENISLSNDQIIKICDRKFIGCDQLIFIKKDSNLDAELEFYNSDGSKSDACGNGTRCVAHLLSKENNKKEINLTVASKILKSKIFENNLVETSIGSPKMNWNEIPLSKNSDTKNLKIKLIDNENKEFIGGIAVNVGNPHVIFFIENIDKFNLEKIGPEIENHELFPEKCNVTLAKKISPNLIKVKVWERGAGLTKACGTAACATAVAANLENLANSKTEIEFSMGKLLINIDEKNNISMMGPVSIIEEIKINI
ncbi:MAG TPA: diaminopimelate epimerase [Candidatus Pelagibacter bacterium]|jgi:diaminopimelate epimerase|nr:diaminopimelate epimerase [Candidatus Pelagibacter bacterium]|tara:strand:- start:1922 stop:2746 length:825 start_codon:yes stop_codon:yes gene_type:complete